MKQTSIYRHEHTVTSHVTSRLHFETKSKPFWQFAYFTFNIAFFDETAGFFLNVLSHSFYCRTSASTTHCKHTFDALFTQDLFSTQANCFTRTRAVGDPVSGTVFKTRETRKGKRAREREGEREQDRETGRRAI